MLGIGFSPLPITNYQLPITNYPLPITHYQLPITNYLLPITSLGDSISIQANMILITRVSQSCFLCCPNITILIY
ncbi:hypothetical protein CEN46_18255 [Fischerella thermalis CCMEE 5318]|uniref:Uncharacterized protein n=1 Tax=Fischerella thermalis CCMEE 5318 TaxID=2019666 RepID=A0A2N6LAM7_9CYAN|nr:hypothetical protein CEN46_18255 [Fischerella thermalis CCMEE 5318]